MLNLLLSYGYVALDSNDVANMGRQLEQERNKTSEEIQEEIKTYKDAYFGVAMACGTVLLIFFIGCLLKIYSSYIDSILQADHVSTFFMRVHFELCHT